MRIEIDIPEQILRLFDAAQTRIATYRVSTAANGVGERKGSFCTPRGRHIIRARIGEGQPLNAVFVKRRPTGEIYTPELGERYPERDWILTRILWLSGCEPGFNRLGENDTMRRYIYIHGTPDSATLGKPDSHGCVRMAGEDLLVLFDQIASGTTVDILS